MNKSLVCMISIIIFISSVIFSIEFASLKIIILDKYDEPLYKALVILHPQKMLLGNRSKETDKNGIVKFDYLLPGEYEIITYYNRHNSYKDTVKESITRKKIILKANQNITLKVKINPEAHLSDYIPYTKLGTYDEKDISESRTEYQEINNFFQQSDSVKEIFAKNNFVIIPSKQNNIYNTYHILKEDKESIFVTTDIVLHTCHLFLDYSLRLTELDYLYSLSKSLTSKMSALSLAQANTGKLNNIKNFARLNASFFEVAERLLNPDKMSSGFTENLVESELEIINFGEGIHRRPILDYLPQESIYANEDYSQYIPRGHYTRNEDFQRYFRALMWLERMNFKLRPGSAPADKEAGRMMTLQALLITDALMNDEEALKSWRALDKTIGFFMGQSDDLGPEDYYPLLSEIFGAKGTPDRFDDDKKLDLFIEKAMRLRDPKILSGLSFTNEGMFQETSKGFSFLGQRSVPDSHIMQELVYSRKETGTILHYTGNGNPFTLFDDPAAGPIRGYPRGLDVMAALGSDRALEILKQEGDTEYSEYDKQIKLLRKTFTDWSDSDWNRTIYNNRLFSIIPLLSLPNSDHLLKFMNSTAWTDKMLCTALGAWSELRHDTLLYSKQDYGLLTVGTHGLSLDKLEFPCGYVEPYPDTYDRLRNTIQQLKKIITEFNLKNDEIIKNAESFEKVLGRLIDISKTELEGKALSKDDYEYIQNVGTNLLLLKGFSPELMSRIVSGSDDRMDVIVDVFTNPWEKKVLEEGVGSPMYIFVYIDDAQGRRICRGMTYSYYEFKQPMNDRLSDEKWQRMGKQNNRPALPAWTKSFIVYE